MKKNKILIILGVAIVLLIITVFSILFFATDIFKSDKEMFYKYISQIDLKEFSNTTGNYQQRLKNNAHEEQGTISMTLKSNGQTYLDNSFSYVTKIDSANKLQSSSIDINQNGQKVLNIGYLRNSDLYGIKFEDIVSQYITIENNNLKDFVSKFDVEDVSNIPNKIEIPESVSNTNFNIDTDELEQILDRYTNIIIEQIPEENYSKVEKGTITVGDKNIEADGYSVKITIKDLQNILLAALETMQNDEQIVNLINSIIKELQATLVETTESMQIDEETANMINSIIPSEITLDDLKNVLETAKQEISQEIQENKELINITIYKQGKDAVKLFIKLGEDGSNVEITMEKLDDKFSIKIYNKQESIIGAITNANSISQMPNHSIETTFVITGNINNEEQEKYDIAFNISQNNEQVANINVNLERNGKLDSDNIQNSFSVNIFAQETEFVLEYKNNTVFNPNIEIEKFEGNNYAIINNFSKEQIQSLFTNLGNKISEKIDLENSILGTIMVAKTGLIEQAQEATEETVNEMESHAIKMFNMQFLIYEGLQSGNNVKMLLQAIATSNSNNFDRLVGHTPIDEEDIDSSKRYNISFQKDSEGYINMVIIEEQ